MSTHLTAEQRYLIYAFNKSEKSTAFIANEIGKSQRTVQRELTRNRGLKGYRPKQAQRLAEARRSKPKPHLLKMTPECIAVIDEKLSLQWSPEQISGWLKKEHLRQAVSHEAIYQYLWQNKKQGGLLFLHLRFFFLKRRGWERITSFPRMKAFTRVHEGRRGLNERKLILLWVVAVIVLW